MNKVQRVFVAATTMVLAASCGGFCGSSGSSASIVGYWTFKGGVVDIRPAGSGFNGIVVRRPQSGPCAEPDGYVLLKLNGSGNHYTGQEEWWSEPTCERLYSHTAMVDVAGDTAHLCATDPFGGSSDSECLDMGRLKSLPAGA